MIPGQYHMPPHMVHQNQGRRQQNHGQQQEYYQGYYQQPYPYQHAPYPQQWYAPQYQQHHMAYRPYPQYHQHPQQQQQHHHAPMVVSSHPQHQTSVSQTQRPSYSSPAPIPAPALIANPAAIQQVPTPVSTQSVDTPASATPNPSIASPTSASTTLATSTASVAQSNHATVAEGDRTPFYPKLPWTSVPESEFPPRTRRRRRKYRHDLTNNLDMPDGRTFSSEGATGTQPAADILIPSLSSIVSDQVTPKTTTDNNQQRDNDAAASLLSASNPSNKPAVPVTPALPMTAKAPVPIQASDARNALNEEPSNDATSQTKESQPSGSINGDSTVAKADVKSVPKSWADLVRSKAQPAKSANANTDDSLADATKPKGASLAEVIRSFDVANPSKYAFLEPRGLVNTGNMCYMNSVLQVLVFCIPFYDLLEQVGQKAVHSFKSETPLLDAMILIAREFNVIDAAESASKLRMRLKDNELEQYGDSFIPEYVYDVIKRLPRFSTMRRGHQQDAEEFMGFLLEGLHDECVTILSQARPLEARLPTSPVPDKAKITESGWHEVGPKQRAAITRSSGNLIAESPIAKIFGGQIRSELRVPGLKNSVTMEPYQSLQLDIGAANISNITDALKGLTRPETLHGDFNSPRGPGTTATKQIFIESLPPVLILHLKRFQYDNTGGVQKIWRKVGYPLELTMPKEVFSPSKRGAMTLNGIPKYRLHAVVYHHGKNASGGHYTVDIRRQDGHEWIRLDDTNIRRVRAEDVASAGAEEDPKVLAKALEAHKTEQSKKGGNIFDSFGEAVDDDDEHSNWSHVNGSSNKDSPAASRKWAAVANGSPTPSSTGKRTPKWEQIKDNKVAYILFYRKMD